MIALRREALNSALDSERLLELPNFVRSAKGSYWHIPRSAERWRDGRVTVSAWCGLGVGSSRTSPATFIDVAPAEMICGTCSGRFDGATADESPLIFRPRDHFAPPTWCPCDDVDESGRYCLACGARIRGHWHGGVSPHHPGPAFAERCSPCPDHGWKHAWTIGGRVLCVVFVGMGWGRCDFDCGPNP